LADPAELDRLLAQGAAKANQIAERTLSDVYDKLGFVRP
jgi:tryptophanyl-tRNA synthetase